LDLRDITNEPALLKSYKTVFVDNQKYELLKIYRDKSRQFPIFTERVFTTSGKSPIGLLDYKTRDSLDDADPGRIFVLERTDNSGDVTRTRLFFVWLSPKLVAQFKGNSADALRVKASVVFHPFPDKYPAYWNGGIDPVKTPNFLELGARYLCKEKHSVTQHFCAIKPGSTPGGKSGLDDKKSQLAVMLVVPVSSTRAFVSLGNPKELQDALEQIARRCYEGVTTKLVAASAMTLDRVAVSGYSRSGVMLRTLLDNAKSNEPFMRSTLKEFYAFDVMLDEKDEKTKAITKTKQKGYEEFWVKLKAWQGEDSNKKIRLYSAEPGTVGSVYAELQERLKRYGGGYHNKNVGFSAFNKTPKTDGSGAYAGLSDGYEIYSTDNSRSLVVLPFGNPLVYLSTENIQNADGFKPGGDYEPALEGHSWFIARLQSHALFHSGF
jgi:hypothetical protein